MRRLKQPKDTIILEKLGPSTTESASTENEIVKNDDFLVDGDYSWNNKVIC